MSAKEERTDRRPGRPRVVCLDCDFAWHSAAMAEGLRALGGCPRCGGELRFDDANTAAAPEMEREPVLSAAPHLALGIPRPRPR